MRSGRPEADRSVIHAESPHAYDEGPSTTLAFDGGTSVRRAIDTLLQSDCDLVIGSRFHAEAQIHGLSGRREQGSTWANASARFSLPSSYGELTDYMSGFFALRLEPLVPLIRAVDVNGFKFLYELLAVSRGRLRTAEVPLRFQPRSYGSSKLDLAIFWDFLISILHSLSFRLLPRRAISFGLVGLKIGRAHV